MNSVLKTIIPTADLLLLVLFCYTNFCCQENNKQQYLAESKRAATNDSILSEARTLIQSGDLILRTGTDFSSDEVKTISPDDKTYSHAGIAVKEENQVYVYHVEPDYYYINDKVRKELLDSFCNPSKNLGIGIARYNLREEQRIAFIHYIDSQYRKKVPFDIHFKLDTDDSMYCSEMILKGLATATSGELMLPTLRFNDKSKFKIIRQYMKLEEKDFVNREIIPIDRLFLNPRCRVLKRYLYFH